MADKPQTSFLACRDCGVLHAILLRSSVWSDEMVEDALGVCDQFRVAHGDHRIAWFERHGEESIADHPLWDPMATISFEVTDGDTLYVATSMRESVETERVYRFVQGSLQLRESEIMLDNESLRRALDREFYPHALRPTKVAGLLSVLCEVVSRIDPANITIAFDEANDPALSIARMPDASYEELLARVAEIFDPWEFSRVIGFLHDNRNEDGVLALRVRRHFSTLAA